MKCTRNALTARSGIPSASVSSVMFAKNFFKTSMVIQIAINVEKQINNNLTKKGNKMAQFKGTVQGNRSEASRLGHKNTGLRTSCNGWNIGVDCYAYFDEETGKDVIRVTETGGSSYSGHTKLITTIIEGE